MEQLIFIWGYQNHLTETGVWYSLLNMTLNVIG